MEGWDGKSVKAHVELVRSEAWQASSDIFDLQCTQDEHRAEIDALETEVDALKRELWALQQIVAALTAKGNQT
ncbi:hypothetical protein BVG79_00169 [Ketogulonicigenium robustum]|uniref:Uncharacterized protein n=1 Tax=Ketogulonicigenium robustum TaxID=92947 RepID=A0A1W6NWE6_9RHOB|nr:hypothetical protein [Ketogulonicigenium robustum]ARO13529.1 hypothetical protein BVG79_00169 [Ketogulonicigenium robustum]